MLSLVCDVKMNEKQSPIRDYDVCSKLEDDVCEPC